MKHDIDNVLSGSKDEEKAKNSSPVLPSEKYLFGLVEIDRGCCLEEATFRTFFYLMISLMFILFCCATAFTMCLIKKEKSVLEKEDVNSLNNVEESSKKRSKKEARIEGVPLPTFQPGLTPLHDYSSMKDDTSPYPSCIALSTNPSAVGSPCYSTDFPLSPRTPAKDPSFEVSMTERTEDELNVQAVAAISNFLAFDAMKMDSREDIRAHPDSYIPSVVTSTNISLVPTPERFAHHNAAKKRALAKPAALNTPSSASMLSEEVFPHGTSQHYGPKTNILQRNRSPLRVQSSSSQSLRAPKGLQSSSKWVNLEPEGTSQSLHPPPSGPPNDFSPSVMRQPSQRPLNAYELRDLIEKEHANDFLTETNQFLSKNLPSPRNHDI